MTGQMWYQGNMLSCFTAALLLVCSSCRPGAEVAYSAPNQNYSIEQYFNERDSTVMLLNPDTGKPSCSAVSIYDSDGSAVLATAAHCLARKVDRLDPAPSAKRESHVGDVLFYVTRSSYPVFNLTRAKIKTLDVTRDRATLSANPYEIPEPLFKARDCDRCTFDDYPVHAVSAVFDWSRHTGFITRMSYSGIGSHFFESDLSIDFGWSGSPVFNSSGEVMGIVTTCHYKEVQIDDHMVEKCIPGWSLFTSPP